MSLRVDMSGNATGFEQMLNKARTQAKGFANSITHEVTSSWGGIGKSIAGAIAGFASFEGVKRGLEWFINTGDQIKDTAEQIDMSADSWQKWSDAVERAGLSTSGFMRVVEALRQKRTDALTDPKARGQLTKLGFSDSEITGKMDMGEFVRRALENGSKGDVSRNALSDVIGSRGVKYASALGELPNAQALFSDDDLKQADELERTMKDIGKAGGTAVVSWVRFFTTLEGFKDTAKFYAYHFSGGLNKLTFGILGKPSAELFKNDEAERQSRENPYGNYKNAKPKKAPELDALTAALPKWFVDQNISPDKKTEPEKDPMDALLEKQREDQALAEQQRQQRLTDSKRSLMTIGERRDSIRGEQGTLAKQIAERSGKMKGEDFLSDADKKSLEGVTGKAREYQVNQLRQKYQQTTDDLQLRRERLTGELKEKPLKFNVDSMSKVGLYSASAFAFNPLLGIAQRTNQILERIEQKLPSYKYNKDPNSP